MDLISHYLTVFNILFAMVLASGDFNRGFGENGQNNVAVSTGVFFSKYNVNEKMIGKCTISLVFLFLCFF